MNTYIKQNLKGNYLTISQDLSELSGYEDSVGEIWEDYINGKYLKLSQEQIEFKENNPSANVKQVWEMYIPPIEPKSLEEYKADKVAEIETYDSSPSINIFYLGNAAIWLDKATRVGLQLRFESELKLGLTTTTLWYGTVAYTLPIESAVQMLLLIEHYASQCYDNTQLHIKNVKELTSIEEVISYDYTTGYPEHLTFEEITD